MINSSTESPLERDDLFEDQGTYDHHPHRHEEQYVAKRCVEQRAEVALVRELDHPCYEERNRDERVGRHPPHRSQRSNLARELLPLANGLCGHVEELCERAADLALDRDCSDREFEVFRPDAV